jgi:Protein of unknown function (DUF1552)
VTSYKIARRAFLRNCGASATMLLPLLRNMEARAQGKPAPLRFLVVHHPLGTQLGPPANGAVDLWRPKLAATTSNYTLPAGGASAPFAPLQSKMVMIDGLNIVAASRVGGITGDKTHEGGLVAIMTGQPILGLAPNTQADFAAGGRSFDQLLLAQSPVLGGAASMTKTPFGSLQLAADIRSDRDEVAPRTMSYLDPLPNVTAIAQARQPLSPETQPINTYTRLFGMGNSDPAKSAALLAQQKSVLDFASADLARLRTLAPTSESGKLDMFAESVRQLENTLSAGLLPGACPQQPLPPPAVKNAMSGTGAAGGLAPSGGTKLSGADYYDASDPNNHPHQMLGMQQLQMIQASFACDLVRVATFMWSPGTNWVVFPKTFQGATIPNIGGNSTPEHPPSHSSDAGTLSWVAQIDQWYATQTSTALQQFDATTDFDGNSLLDNTVVVYISEVARAYDHDFRNVPYLVFGGKNTKIKGGQFIKVTDGHLSTDQGGMTNRPTNDVWLALAPIFGVTLPSLGATTQYTGPLPGLVG